MNLYEQKLFPGQASSKSQLVGKKNKNTNYNSTMKAHSLAANFSTSNQKYKHKIDKINKLEDEIKNEVCEN